MLAGYAGSRGDSASQAVSGATGRLVLEKVNVKQVRCRAKTVHQGVDRGHGFVQMTVLGEIGATAGVIGSSALPIRRIHKVVALAERSNAEDARTLANGGLGACVKVMRTPAVQVKAKTNHVASVAHKLEYVIHPVLGDNGESVKPEVAHRVKLRLRVVDSVVKKRGPVPLNVDGGIGDHVQTQEYALLVMRSLCNVDRQMLVCVSMVNNGTRVTPHANGTMEDV